MSTSGHCWPLHPSTPLNGCMALHCFIALYIKVATLHNATTATRTLMFISPQRRLGVCPVGRSTGSADALDPMLWLGVKALQRFTLNYQAVSHLRNLRCVIDTQTASSTSGGCWHFVFFFFFFFYFVFFTGSASNRRDASFGSFVGFCPNSNPNSNPRLCLTSLYFTVLKLGRLSVHFLDLTFCFVRVAVH